jgi:hypothetical protein
METEVKEKIKPKTPKLNWKDFLNSLIELDNTLILDKISQSFDIAILAAESFKSEEILEGTVFGMKIEIEGFKQKVNTDLVLKISYYSDLS